MLLELLVGLDVKTLLLISFVFLGVILLYSRRKQTSPQLPPFPGLPLPVVGHLYLLNANPRPQFMKWGETYGPMFSLYLGNQLAIVLHGFDMIKEAFVLHAEHFSDRPRTFVTQVLGKDRGFVTSGPHWKVQRKISIEIFRDLGLGTGVMEEKVQAEISLLFSKMDRQNGVAFDPRESIMQSISNVVSVLVFGEGFRHEDPSIANCARMIGEQISLLEGTVVLNFLPFLRLLPGDLFGLQKVLRIRDQLEQDLILKQTEINKRTPKDAKVTGFLRKYLNRIEMEKQQGLHHSEVNEENMIAVVQNLFAAGTETTCTTLCWAILYLLHHPDVQERCYQEIKDTVDNGRRPGFMDRNHMRYLEATVMEVQRIASIAPFSLHHTASADLVLRNYRIPKGSIIMPSLDSVLRSKEIWGDPQNFRPERFLDESGRELVKREELIPFSIGRRACLGEALAKMELILYLSAIIQKYHICLPSGAALPPLADRFGLSCAPQPFNVCFMPR